MAYEVTKLVNGRPYRYRVHAERDPETGKFRNRWTYLGRADQAGQGGTKRARANARTALLDAMARLFETLPPDEVTPTAISTEAGVAHGTFYRYFPNKNAALVALLDRIRDDLRRELDPLEAEPASREEARAAMRAWLVGATRKRERYPGLMRAVFDLSARDPALAELRSARRAAFIERWREHLTMLAARGFTYVRDIDATAAVLAIMYEGYTRAVFLGIVEPDTITAAADVVDAAIFASPG